jgi:tRNA (cmo5U34)-methyltransferase
MLMTTNVRSHELVEDWSDDAFVTHWIDRQTGRAEQRRRQFSLLRAMIPFGADAPFRYLNVGAGPGPFDELVLRRHSQAQATLLDGSAVMLRHAGERLAEFGARFNLVHADFGSSEWAASVQGPFDLVVSCIAIHNLRDATRIRAVYAEIYGLLADGGLFLNLDYVRMPSQALQSIAAWSAADRDSGFMTGGGGADLPGTTDEQVGWLHEAGFAVADCFFKEFRLALFGGFKGTPRVPEPTLRRG